MLIGCAGLLRDYNVVIEVEEAYPATRDALYNELHKNGMIARRYFYPGCHKSERYASCIRRSGLRIPKSFAAGCWLYRAAAG